ncbi:MAG: hypothetical protein ACTS4W_00910 [Candidatus Hodgkinia cicadicola]
MAKAFWIRDKLVNSIIEYGISTLLTYLQISCINPKGLTISREISKGDWRSIFCLCGSAFAAKRISKFVSVTFVQYLPMWSFMRHIITIDVIPNGILPF